VELCAGAIRPFNIFDGPHMKNLIQKAVDLGAKYGSFDAGKLISHPTTISRALKAIADDKRQEISPTICNYIKCNMCAATTDLWTENFHKRHYITVTAHYIDDDYKLNSRVLATEKFGDDSETGANISKAIKQIFVQYDVEQDDVKKLKFTTDGGANVVKAISLLGSKRISCADHILC